MATPYSVLFNVRLNSEPDRYFLNLVFNIYTCVKISVVYSITAFTSPLSVFQIKVLIDVITNVTSFTTWKKCQSFEHYFVIPISFIFKHSVKVPNETSENACANL